MVIILRDGRNFGYKYICPKCTTQYIATHDEEHRTSSQNIYTPCPVCGKGSVWADTTKDIDCSQLIELRKNLKENQERA